MPLTDREAERVTRLKTSPDPSERNDAMGQFLWHFVDTNQVRKFQDVLPQTPQEMYPLLVRGAEAEKAMRLNRRNSSDGSSQRSSLDRNPWNTSTDVPGLRSRKGKTPGWLLRAEADQNFVISSILSLIKNRTLNHARPYERSETSILNQLEGFDFILVDAPPHEELSEDNAAYRRMLVNFALSSGDTPRYVPDGGKTSADLRRLPLDNFWEELTHDRFTIAQLAIEPNYSRNGKYIKGYYTVDPDTIYHSLAPWEDGYGAGVLRNPDLLYAQVINKQIYTAFKSNELYFSIANSRSALGAPGYGFSEVEMTHKLTVAILNILSMTNSQFDRNALPEGFVTLSGNLSQEALTYFRDDYLAFREDPGGSLGVPVVHFPDPQAKLGFTRIGKGPDDMQNQHYASLVIAGTCAPFGVDVQELNFSSHGGSNAGLSSGKDTKARMEDSRNRGWLPWMSKLERTMNDVMAPLLGTKWKFVWRGLTKLDPTALHEMFLLAATVDEVRATMGMKPLGGDSGNSLAKNPAISQLILANKGQGVSDKISKPAPKDKSFTDPFER